MKATQKTTTPDRSRRDLSQGNGGYVPRLGRLTAPNEPRPVAVSISRACKGHGSDAPRSLRDAWLREARSIGLGGVKFYEATKQHRDCRDRTWRE